MNPGCSESENLSTLLPLQLRPIEILLSNFTLTQLLQIRSPQHCINAIRKKHQKHANIH